MRRAALLVGLAIAAVGVVGLVAPARLLNTAGAWLSPLTLYVVAAVRVLAGGILLAAARQGRAPTTLRVLGAIFLLNGLVTPAIGLQRARALLEWASLQSFALVRLAAVAALAVGVVVAYASSPSRRAARQTLPARP